LVGKTFKFLFWIQCIILATFETIESQLHGGEVHAIVAMIRILTMRNNRRILSIIEREGKKIFLQLHLFFIMRYSKSPILMIKNINQNDMIAFTVIALKKLKISVIIDTTEARKIPEITNASLKFNSDFKIF
jgi:hypothetical protein